MLKTIFTKTLYDKRWSILFWSIGIMLMALLTMTFYHSFSQDNGLAESLQNVPKQLQSLIGDTASLKTVAGFVNQQIFAFRMPLFTIIFSIITFNSLLAGDEAEGTLQTLLTQPVSRLRVLAEKVLAGLTALAVLHAGIFVAVWFGLQLIDESIALSKLVAACLNCWLVSAVFGLLVLTIGAITGRKSLASGVASAVAFLSYFITSLAPSVSSLQALEKITPIYYYNQPAVAQKGLDASNLALLALVCLLMFAVSLVVFNRRDVYQR